MFPRRAENLSNLISDNRLLEHARLLDQEVRLAAQIADPDLIDKKTIGDVIGVARRLASAGCPLQLVELDEILDIAQIFSLRIPQLSELSTKPTADAASNILEKLQTKLENKDHPVWKDPVWTARVAAVLAYFSALKAG